MRLGNVINEEKEFNEKNILAHLIFFMIVYTYTLIVYSYENGFNYILGIPYILCLALYVVFDEVNSDIKQRNDIKFNALKDADTKYNNALREALERF